MSQYQPRGDGFARRPSRSGSFGGHRGGGRSGGAVVATQTSSSSQPSPAGGAAQPTVGNRSFRKEGNGPGAVQNRGNQVHAGEPGAALTPAQTMANSGHGLPRPAAISIGAENPTNVSRPANPLHTSPTVPQAQPPSKSSDSSPAPIPPKGDAPKNISLQFGSMVPVEMSNGLQIPARTNSAPPNLDEQKNNPAFHEAYTAVSKKPLPSVPKPSQPQSTKDNAAASNQSNSGPAPAPAASSVPTPTPVPAAAPPKRDLQTSHPSAPSAAPPRPPVPHSLSGMPIQVPFHHPPQMQLQFGLNQQISSHNVGLGPMQMPMGIAGSNAPQLQPPIQQLFLPGIQPHPMQQPAMIHQGQGLSFIPSRGNQVTPQFSNMGLPMLQPYPQQPASKQIQSRVPVKITRPDTHEEVKFEKRADSHVESASSGQRSLPNVTPQPHPIPQYPNLGYYPQNSFASPSMFYSGNAAVTIASNPMPTGSQGQRFNYPGAFINPQVINPMAGGNIESLPGTSSSAPIHIARPPVGTSSVTISRPPKTSTSHPQKDAENNPASSTVRSAESVTVVQSKTAPPEPKASVMLADRNPSLPITSAVSTNAVQKSESSQSTDSATKSDVPEASGDAEPSTSVDAAVIISERSQKASSCSEDIPVDDSALDSSKPSLLPETTGSMVYLEVSKSAGVILAGPGQGDDESADVQHQVVLSDGSEHIMTEGNAVDGTINSPSSLMVVTDVEHASSDSLPTVDASVDIHESADSTVSGVNLSESVSVVQSIPQEDKEKHDGSIKDQSSATSKEKPVVEVTRPKSAAGKKKRRKDMLSKADAAGSSDLYNAYTGMGEKSEGVAVEGLETSSTSDATQVVVEEMDKDTSLIEDDAPKKIEPDDWEHAAELSTAKTSVEEVQDYGADENNLADKDATEASVRKRYSRDFLLTFAHQYMDLPVGFQIGADVTEVLMSGLAGKSYVIDREPFPSPGRGLDRPPSRNDRWTGVANDDDKRTKLPGSLSSVIRDQRLDGRPGANFPGQGVGAGSMRTPRGATHQGGILRGPMPTTAPYRGSIHPSGSDTARWAHTPSPSGLIPSPVLPHQVMHKAERKYEVGKVSDEEEGKQRQLKGILNKLTPENFDRLFAQVKEVNIDNPITLSGVISQIFDKALMEPTFCEMYANFCFHLATALPNFDAGTEKITFKRLLLNKCQEEFERGEREEAEADRTEEEGEVKQTKEQREEKRLKARRRMLGNIRLIGELYKQRMLTDRIMHECIKKLLGQYQNPDEEDVEALCKLMSTIGEMIDQPKAKEHMDAYFEIMQKQSTNQKLSSRVRFMLRDTIDLRKNKWHQRRKVEGPKRIDEVHRDAAQERQGQASKSSRGPPPRRGAPVDYGPRGGAPLVSPVSQQVGSRGMRTQARGFGTQDVRFEERHQLENKSAPILQRLTREESITLGPQGGLARNMASRGQPAISNAEISHGSVDHHKLATGSNGSIATNSTSNSALHAVDRVNRQSRNVDPSPDRYAPTNGNNIRDHGPSIASAVGNSEVRLLSEDALRNKSLSALREFYSAKDVNEVVLCIEELNAPSFYPSLVMIWVNDSFERKDLERQLLAKLIVDICKPQDALLTQSHLIEGIESVLSTLEDTVNDAPRAAEYLGRLLSTLVIESVVPLSEVGRLIREGGEETGALVESGLAADVLGNMLETMKADVGDGSLKDMLKSSNLSLPDFRPSSIRKSKLDAFID